MVAGEPPALEGDLRLDRDRILEGDPLHATLAVSNRGGGARVEVQLPAAAQLDGDPTPIDHTWLDAKGVKHTMVETPGAHTWMVWRRNLATLAPLLF